VGRHNVPVELAAPEDKPRYRFVVAFSAIVLLAFASMAVVAALFPERAPQARANPGDLAASGNPFPPISAGRAGTVSAPRGRSATATPQATNPASGTTTAPVAGTFQLSQDWNNKFIGAVQLSNGTGSAQAWQVQLAFPDNVGDLQARWISGGPGDMTVTRAGQTVTFTGQTPLAAGAHIGVNFQFGKTAGSPTPRTCSVNGRACAA
jgi:hypothetical protein